MGSDAPQTQPAVRYRPHVWLALAFWAMAPFFGLLAFGDVLTDPTVDINCRRDDARARCEVVTEGLLRPSVAPLSDADLRGARIDVVPEPHDRSFKKVELRRGESVRLLAEFTRSAHARAVGEVNAFLAGVSNGPISVRVVGSPHTPLAAIGFLPLPADRAPLRRGRLVQLRPPDDADRRRAESWKSGVRAGRGRRWCSGGACGRLPASRRSRAFRRGWRRWSRRSPGGTSTGRMPSRSGRRTARRS